MSGIWKPSNAVPYTLFALIFNVTSLPTARAQFIQQGSKLVGSGIPSAIGGSNFAALSGDGNTVIIGSGNDSGGVGAAWVYTRSGGVWTQQGGKLVGTGAVGRAGQGGSVALSSDGNTAIVGGVSDNCLSGCVGAAWVFTRSGNVWTQQGNKLLGTGAVGGSNQGWSVALSGDGNTAIVGGPGDGAPPPSNTAPGAAWVFTRSGNVWTQQGNKLVGTGAVGNATQGSSVALSADGNTAIVGGQFDGAPASSNTLGSGPGATWVFTRSGNVWTQQSGKLVGTGAVGGAAQGSAVALSADGNTAIVGGPTDASPPMSSGIGAAWMFTRSGNVWTQQGLYAGNPENSVSRLENVS